MKQVEGLGAEWPVEIVTADAGLAAALAARLRRAGVAAQTGRAGERRDEACAILVLDTDGAEAEAVSIIADRRTRNPALVVIALGTAPRRDLLVGLMRAGTLDFVEKPVDVDGLGERLVGMYTRSAVARMRRDVTRRLADSADRVERDQAELHREIIRSNEELVLLNRRLRKVVGQLRTLYHMGRDLGENENWSDALDRFLMALVSFMNAEGAALLLYSEGERVLRARSTYQIGRLALETACRRVLEGRASHPRAMEIHPLESYEERRRTACLERGEPWRMTLIPLRHRSQWLGFLLLDKRYRDQRDFEGDYDFLNTLQTIFAEEIANAAYISRLRHLGRFNDKVLDNIQAGVVTTDLEGNVRYANAAAMALCPALRRREPPCPFDDLFTSRDVEGGLFASLMASPHDAVELEVTCHAAADAEFPARMRATRMFDDDVNGTVLVAIFDDLTEQRRMEAEIRRNDRLRAIGQLAAGVAHEIRNPLTGIANCAEVLAGRLDGGDDRRRYTDAMLDEVRRLDGIVRNLLTYARPPRPRPTDVAVTGVVGRVLELAHEEAARRDVVLEGDVGADVFVHADGGQLTQVLLNLVMNAIQACGAGDRVRVKAERDGARVVLRVEDDGCGVPLDVRGRLFEPFVTTRSQGTGLGLAISRQLVEDQGGTIDVEFLERGTAFTVTLPAATAAPTAPDASGGAPQRKGAADAA